MKLSKHKIQTYLNTDAFISYDRKKLEAAITQSKLAFCESEAAGSLSYPEFLYQQSHYIRKRWWILQGLILLLLWLLFYVGENNLPLQKCMGAAAPLFATFVLPELWKNRNTHTLEIECAACYSLQQIYAARIFLFALADLLLLSIFAFTAIGMGKLSLETFIIQFFLPYLVACCICFRTLYSPRITSETFAILLCMVWSALWIQLVLTEHIYNAISAPLWFVMTGMAALYLGYCIQKGQRNVQTIWEVKAQWN